MRNLVIDGCVQIWPDADFAAIPDLGVSAFLLTTFDPYVDFNAAIAEMNTWHDRVQQYPDRLAIPLRPGDITSAWEQGRTSLIFGCQGLDFIGNRLQHLEQAWRLGLRLAQPTYNDANLIGDGCLKPRNAGLTTFGKRVIAEMNRLGMVIDLSHVGRRTSMEAIDLAAGPVVFSHANPRTVVKSPRNITNEQIQACAATGGVIGISPWGPLAWRHPETGRPKLADFIACIEYVVDLGGPAHVGVGTDLSIGTYDTTIHAEMVSAYPSVFAEYGRVVSADVGSPLRYVEGFDDFSGFARLPDALHARGFGPEAIKGILGGNFLRVFEENWAKAPAE